ncbi:DNA alkylation repair enzyme [Corynebacterium occultum]|uniref:DNA alkylation repair enzyme n=1 Tax=Corynebacterium occultum TaxID=2675219 RepID=A0A6B8W953_9CORY|nr:DNA alkylation repair enzyme [Corynebacterium occultum]
MTNSTQEIQQDLEDLSGHTILAVNEKHGDDHSVNLTKLRAVAKQLKKNHPLALELWATGDSNARLLALLIARTKEFSATELDTMLRESRTPKVRDWLVNYHVKNPRTLSSCAGTGSGRWTRM